MAFNQTLTDLIRERLIDTPNVSEKVMFRGVTFMVNDKMCISVGDNEILFRIDPVIHEEIMPKEGCRTMEMKGRSYIGYVYVNENTLKIQTELDYWVNLALEFNVKAKASKKKKK